MIFCKLVIFSLVLIQYSIGSQHFIAVFHCSIILFCLVFSVNMWEKILLDKCLTKRGDPTRVHGGYMGKSNTRAQNTTESSISVWNPTVTRANIYELMAPWKHGRNKKGFKWLTERCPLKNMQLCSCQRVF